MLAKLGFWGHCQSHILTASRLQPLTLVLLNDAARYLVAKFAPGIFTSALERQRRPIPDLRRRSAPTSPFRPYEQEAYR